MREQDRAKWDRPRAEGKRRFVLRRGVVGWGLSSGLLFAMLSEMDGVQHVHNVWLALPRTILLFLVGGYFWGVSMWSYIERSDRKNGRGGLAK